jgi:hypothetical protein
MRSCSLSTPPADLVDGQTLVAHALGNPLGHLVLANEVRRTTVGKVACSSFLHLSGDAWKGFPVRPVA